MIMLSWVVIGIIVGGISYYIRSNSSKTELISLLALSSFGALIGGFLANSFSEATTFGFSTSSFALSLLGSISLILAGKELETI